MSRRLTRSTEEMGSMIREALEIIALIIVTLLVCGGLFFLCLITGCDSGMVAH